MDSFTPPKKSNPINYNYQIFKEKKNPIFYVSF